MKNLTLIFFIFSLLSYSQNNFTSARSIEISENNYEEQLRSSIVKNIELTNIGPSVMSGRVTDLEVNPNNPTEFYVAYASGGLWHTKNNGTTFSPIMDNSMTQNIGDFAIDWESNSIYVGTGESNSSRSSYPGIGIIKSNDNGSTWSNIGLRDSHHISRVLVNPNNENHLVVAVIGHLYTKNKQRGIFTSFDNGKTWEKSLFINDHTGAIDLVVDPENFDIQYAAFWERERKAWNFVGSGDNSGIYKSIDGGKNWELITTKSSGFPTGEGVGRIGLSIFNSSIIYAVLDNQFRRPADQKKTKLSRLDFKDMSKSDFLKLEDKELKAFISQNNFPKENDLENIKTRIQKDELYPNDIYKFLTDANAELFDSAVIGAEVYKSVDAGKTWKKMNEDYLDGVYSSYGYYFGRIHVSPVDSEQIYIYGVPLLKSNDSGKTFSDIGASNVHVDHHDLWINPNDNNHLVLGNDGGVNISYDQGDNWIKLNQPSVGQFYSINVDNSEPYNVYGGLQDNGVWMASNNSVESPYWYESGHNNWTKIMGGDGMQIQIDKRNNNIVYTGLQFGNYYRLDLENESRKNIKPRHKLGQSPLRFNWQTPILISKHNQDIIYFGSNKLHRSLDKGNNWDEISDDLTNGGLKGNVPYGTITTFDESTHEFGKIVVGTDDGNIILTQDSGTNWKPINNGLPSSLWVSRVIFSNHNENRIYASLNGYRLNNFEPHLYASDDNGNTWNKISSNLPLSPINVIREDIKDERILYVGTDNGLFISFDLGLNWHPFSSNLPRVAIHDLVIQNEKNELIVGTHGRSIYKLNLELFSKFNKLHKSSSSFTVLKLDEPKYSSFWGSKRNYTTEIYSPEISVHIYSSTSQILNYQVLNKNSKFLNGGKIELDKGFNTVNLPTFIDPNLSLKQIKKIGFEVKNYDDGKTYLNKGKYILKIENKTIDFSVN